MAVFPSIDGEPALDKVFRRFPHTVLPLLEYHDRLLRDWSPLRQLPGLVAPVAAGGRVSG